MPKRDPPGPPNADVVDASTLSQAPSPAVAASDATLPAPSAAGGAEPSPSRRHLEVVDKSNYAVVGEVGRGGLGRVVRAHDLRLERSVALKELIESTPAARDRFLREALVTARLQHPAIVPVYEAGLWSSGEPFYAMKLVGGRTLEQVLREQRSLDERLAQLPSVITVADAVAFAHSRRVIHRDLKPENVLVGDFGETVVIDWGLAKDLDAADAPPPVGAGLYQAATSGATVAGSVMGTPAYMPPEQAAGADADERSDVYALGAILYRLLAGVPPYTGSSAQELLAAVSAVAPERVGAREPGAPPELCAIVDKAMARQRDDRYPSARELADDLRRFQTGQLVRAHAYTPLQRARRFLRRHRAAVAIAALLGVVLTVGAVVSVARITRERDIAARERDRAGAEAETARMRSRELLLEQARSALATDPNRSLELLAELGPDHAELAAARAIAAEAIHRGAAKLRLRGHQRWIYDVTLSPTGTHLASASVDGTAVVWSLIDLRPQRLVGHGDLVMRATFSPDGLRLATASRDGTARIWPLDGGEPMVLRGHERWVEGVAFSPDGRQLATVGQDGTMRVWDTATGAGRVVVADETARDSPRFTADGKRLVSASRVVELATGESWRLGAGGGDVFEVPVSADGRLAATVGDQLWLLDLETRRRTELTAAGVAGPFTSGLFSPDGRWLATGTEGGALALWPTAGGRPLVVHAHDGNVYGLFFAGDGNRIATSSDDGLVKIWALDGSLVQVVSGFGGPVEVYGALAGGAWVTASVDEIRVIEVDHVRYQPGRGPPARSADGELVAFPAEGGRVLVTRADGTPVRELGGHQGPAQLGFARRGAALVTVETRAGGMLRVFDVAAGDERLAVALPVATASLATAAAAEVALLRDDAGLLLRIELASGATTELVRGGAGDRHAISADGNWIAIALEPGDLELRRADAAPALVSLGGAKVRRLEFSPDGAQLAVISEDRYAWLVDSATGAARRLGRHVDRGNDIEFAADGSWFATADLDGAVRRWSRDGEITPAIELAGGAAPIYIAISPDATRLAISCFDGRLRLFDLAGGERREITGSWGDALLRPSFSADGEWLVAGGRAGLWSWHDEVPGDAPGLAAWLRSYRRLDAR